MGKNRVSSSKTGGIVVFEKKTDIYNYLKDRKSGSFGEMLVIIN